MRPQITDQLFTIAGVAILFSILGIWQLISMSNILPATVFPPASAVLVALYEETLNGSFPVSILATLMRLLEGYFLAALIGTVVGVSMGMSRIAYYTGDPLVQFLRPMPSVILIPLAILYFGLGDFLIVSVVAYSCIWPILINTMDGVRSIDPMILDTAREFRVGRVRKFRKIILPASAPFIFSGLRVSLAVGWIVGITAEIISTASNTGIGALIYLDLNTGNLTPIYAAIIAIAVTAYALNRAFLIIEHRIIPWYEKSKRRR
ncbi:MAG: ABC transporter permease [Thaumarchaeota archaeon]|nr:ABC transporter permease [Nitrososphaerota archaeon]